MASKAVTDGLKKVLSDTFILYFKTHSFHWNVEGPQFKALHEMFETQYNELWKATDEIAERIRALGDYAPNNLEAIASHASLQETGQTPDARAMVEMLANDNAAIVEVMRPVLHTAEDKDDEVTVDLMIQRMAAHEKAAWMLRSMSKGA